MQQVNKLAPGLSGELSAGAARAVADRLASGGLSPFACKDTSAIRRSSAERDRDTQIRPAFVRDAEKIVHLPAYNRMSGKTQVFSFRANDDLSRRGLHVQLVARVARDIGRALGLNIDLIEAIALGHDIGHTPFGHAGERFLNDVFHERTGRWFFHNVQSVRVIDVLGGRNVSLQTLDGCLTHNGEFEQQVFETSGLAEFDTFDRVVASCWETGEGAIGHLRPMTLEGCVVRISDIIAYVGKDRQDAVRAGLLSEDAFDDGLGGGYNAWALSAFVADVVENSVGKPCIAMSEEGFAELKRAKRENYEKIYGAGEVSSGLGRETAQLFCALYDHELEALRAGDESSAIFCQHIRGCERRLAHYGREYDWEDDLDQTIVDFISAMTDDYFMATCEAVFPESAGLFPLRGYFGEGVRP
ncbi:deoxyguanosinetriphosphate triphosphohydrolase family protein [Paratractidigestivibacter sp.]|uniref:deoxyguanosinetriphosphate triphosphohydrolase family protein n=1 Tax=Paratractidigestivibacter sp. TaxID=2847316 RepID=UPI002ABE758F|nr:HD domain-containing protein [Paratractidigestivibacter sp.]